jgi:hypothetical protein
MSQSIPKRWGPPSESGFSLIEVLVSIAIMMALCEAVAVAYVHMFSQSKRAKTHSSLDEQLKYLGNYMTYRLQAVGGGAVRPWAAVWVEDGCAARGPFPACGGSDRITTAALDGAIPECTIIGTVGASTLQIEKPLGVCCLTAAFNNRQAVLSNGDYFSQQYLTLADPVGCTVNVSPGAAFGGLNNPPGVFAGWTSGHLSVVNVATLYLDTASTELREFQDLNFNGVIDPGEETVLADQIFDVQYALGYDANPRDGRVTNNNDDTDEWLYNSNGLNEGMGIGGLTGALPSDLRMVAVGLIIGDRVNGQLPVQAQVLNGPPRSMTDWQLSQSVIRFRFRNVGVFLPNG